jgi:antitoxin CptB
MSDRVQLEKLKWKCRRGLLELDIVLDRYLRGAQIDPHLSELLDLPDNDLWDIVAGRSEDYPSQFTQVVAQLRAA